MNLVLYNRDTLAQFPALLNELDQLVTRINTVFNQQHDPQTGEHTDISVTGLEFGGDIQTTVGAAGGASALPATPLGYFEITIDGAAVVVPFYLKS
jgi:hypothetical protein